MKKGKFSSDQISKILKEFEQGKSLEEIMREHGVSRARHISVYIKQILSFFFASLFSAPSESVLDYP